MFDGTLSSKIENLAAIPIKENFLKQNYRHFMDIVSILSSVFKMYAYL